jgi:hypothetical protein
MFLKKIIITFGFQPQIVKTFLNFSKLRGFYHKDMEIMGSSNIGSLHEIFLKSNVSSGKGKMVII